MTKLSWKSVCQSAAGLTFAALAGQGMGHPLDDAQRVPSRNMRSPVRPHKQGDWRTSPAGVSNLVHPQTHDLLLQAPARANISHPVKQPAATGLTVVPLIGCSSEDYIAPITIGNTNVFQVIVDSGSTTTAVAGRSCTTCNVSPKYSPGESASDTGEPIQAQYGLGDWEGEGYSDVIRLGTGPSTTVQFGAIFDQEQWFSGGNCLSDGNPSTTALNQGIMGVGPASLALDGTSSYFDAITSKLKANAYAVGLCDVGGTMWMGGYDTNSINGSMVQLPMTQSPYYAVDMTAIKVGSKDAGVTDSDLGYAIVDTGTTQIILPDSAFQSVVQLIVDGSENHLDTDFFNGETCIALPQSVTLDDVDAELPKLTLSFGNNDNVGGTGGSGSDPDPFFDPYDDYDDGFDAEPAVHSLRFSPPPSPPTPIWGENPPSASPAASSSGSAATLTFSATASYLMPMLDSQGRVNVCPGLGSAGQEDVTILGNTLMHNNVVVFDVSGQQVGWAQSKNICA